MLDRKVEALVAEELDDLPGLQRPVASLAAAALASILMAAVAGATQAVKDNN